MSGRLSVREGRGRGSDLKTLSCLPVHLLSTVGNPHPSPSPLNEGPQSRSVWCYGRVGTSHPPGVPGPTSSHVPRPAGRCGVRVYGMNLSGPTVKGRKGEDILSSFFRHSKGAEGSPTIPGCPPGGRVQSGKSSLRPRPLGEESGR